MGEGDYFCKSTAENKNKADVGRFATLLMGNSKIKSRYKLLILEFLKSVEFYLKLGEQNLIQI